MNIRHLLSWILFITGFCFIFISLLYPVTIWYWSWLVRPPKLFDPAAVSAFPIPKVLTSDGRYADITMNNPNAWFADVQMATPSSTTINSFLLSFPTLKITDIPVKVNGSNLKFSPIHYPGTALPGELGNTVILGHSALPHLYLLKSPLAIFNPILKLKMGDTLMINFNNLNFHYRINKIYEVTPDKIEVLNQPSDRYQLTLITCVPLGTYLRRLVVVGDLIN